MKYIFWMIVVVVAMKVLAATKWMITMMMKAKE